MGLIYAAGFQVGGVNTLTCSTLGVGATIASGYYFPGDLVSSEISTLPAGTAYSGQAYTAFTAAVKTAFDAAIAGPFTVTWNSVTGKYTVSRGSTFAMTWLTPADSRLRDALGFTSDKSGASSYTSDVVPAYIFESAVSGRTNFDTVMVEPDDIADEMVSDGGQAFVITRKSQEAACRWTQSHEVKSSTYEWARNEASGRLIPWPLQTWFRNVRGDHPFWVNEITEGSADGDFYRLTASGAAFKPQRVMSDDDSYFVVPFATRWIGRRTL